MPRVSVVMVAYGLFLVAGAVLAVSISGWDRSKTALFSSGGAALLMFCCAFAASRSRPRWTAMVGAHLGMVLPLLYAATFAWRLSLNWGKPTEPEWLARNPGQTLVTAEVQSVLQNWLFPAFIVGSLVAFFLILRLRPERPAAPVADPA